VAEALLLGNRIGVIDAGALVGLHTPKDFMEATEPVTAAYIANLRMLEKLEGPG
jgi:ABC-type proline/glycine betaine transport system ATPase subunit